jgi:hypothetical protein
MPVPTGVVDALSTPPFVSLNQVLDTSGPYTAGDHTLTQFTTSGAFLLPAGTYGVSGTYGVIVQPTTIPPQWGFDIGWNDVSFPIASGDEYEPRLAQLCVIHTLPISGARIITQREDIHLVQQLILWPLLIGSAAAIGLHVEPGIVVDLFYMCVL